MEKIDVEIKGAVKTRHVKGVSCLFVHSIRTNSLAEAAPVL